MKVIPKSEEELEAERQANLDKGRAEVWPIGEYAFEVIDARDAVSKNGNEMIVLDLEVYHNGDSKRVTDYLVAAMEHKVRHAADSCGLIN